MELTIDELASQAQLPVRTLREYHSMRLLPAPEKRGRVGVYGAAHVERLEKALDDFNDSLPPLKEFILPGGGPAAAACHLARTVARRAERRVWALAEAESVSAEVTRYLNRLSDLLFVLARVLARHERGVEVLWRHERDKSK